MKVFGEIVLNTLRQNELEARETRRYMYTRPKEDASSDGFTINAIAKL